MIFENNLYTSTTKCKYAKNENLLKFKQSVIRKGTKKYIKKASRCGQNVLMVS